MRDHLLLLIAYDDDPVVSMQINPAVEWHLLSPQSGDIVGCASPLQPHCSA
jgi:hypothetical protein